MSRSKLTNFSKVFLINDNFLRFIRRGKSKRDRASDTMTLADFVEDESIIASRWQ